LAEDRNAAKAAGMDGFVAKPLSPSRLIDELLKFIQPRQQSNPMISSSKMALSDFDLAGTMGDLEALLIILQKNRAVPDPLITALHSRLAGHPAMELLETLSRQISIFDFDSARATVEKIINEVKM
jgi:hypothetical protein